jgi:hypothetical protein
MSTGLQLKWINNELGVALLVGDKKRRKLTPGREGGVRNMSFTE